MGKLQSSLLILLSLVCLTWGWESGNQYVYKYVGRSVTGIYKLKMQNAVIELQSRVVVQSIDENNVIVKLENGKIRRTGKYLENPFHIAGDQGSPEEIEGEEDAILNPEFLGAPFAISHNKGSITGIQIGSDEPLWVVNFKKGIASQLQMDITGVRSVGPAVNWQSAPKDGESIVFTTFEDSVTGDCSTSIGVSRLSALQVVSSEAFKLGSFDAICKGKPVYKITKTKDLNNCKSSPSWHSTTSGVHECDFSKGNCGNFIKRVTESNYLACGDHFPKVTFVHSYAFSDFMVQPFATKTEELLNSVIVSLRLESKESISSPLSVSSPKSHESLSYVFDDFQQVNGDGTPVQPNLVDAYLKSPVPVSTMHSGIVEALTAVASDLKDKPDAEQDNIERLAVIGRVLQMFSLEELKSLWQEIKDQDSIVVTLFVDCVVQAGSNPAVMLIKELVESEQITGVKATWALAALGYYVKTPTRELLHELVNLLKSSPVQSSKTITQTAMFAVADLMNMACGSHLSAAKKYPVSVMGDFCDSKDSVIINEFIPLLTRELESSEKTFDRIVALATFGSLGLEEILPVLLPVIRGTPGQFDDTAERLRAILSLQRVVFTVPEKVHPILASLASNVGERHEIRMASLGLLLMSNAPQALWQKFAAHSWFESNRQMASFTHKLIQSIAKISGASPILRELSKKANMVLPITKPHPFGLPFSFADIQSSHLDEGITSLMYTISMRDATQKWPVYLAHRYSYQLGPLPRSPLSVYMWNFNMSDLWQKVIGNLFKSAAEKKSSGKDGLKAIWDELNATPRPSDKRAGVLHINLMDSINRFVDLEKMIESIPNFMAGASKYQNKPYVVNVVKYRMLGEYNVRYPSDLGLPVRYLFNLPILASIQGEMKSDGKGGIKSDISLANSWKLTAEIRVELPFSGNYIATGVDVLVDSQTPKEFNFNYDTQNGEFKIGYTPSSKVTDLMYYHVKPYTVSRNLVDSIKPTLEDAQNVNIISVTDKPIVREVAIGHYFGLNVKLIEQSEEAHSDKMSWFEYFSKWNVNSLSNLGFVPLSLRSRKYVMRYDPSGTRAKSISSTYLFQYAVKSSQSNVIYETGTSRPTNPTAANEIVSYKPIGAIFRPVLGRVFKNLESGNARLASAILTAELKDGSLIQLSSLVGLSKNTRYTKDYIDWLVEYSTSKAGGADRKVNYAVCYTAVRKWNSPPNYGFSKDVLEMTEEDSIGFGPQCDSKAHFTAKLSRDAEAAKAALNSPSGQKCVKDMASGFKYGSSSCAEARRLDHTYNIYELQYNHKNLTDTTLQLARQFTTFNNYLLYPFTVKHVHAQSNTALQTKWTIKRDPVTGDSDMTFVRPHETVVAKNVRWGENNAWYRVSPLTWALSQVYYPLNAATDTITDTLTLISAGVSEGRCYIGDDAVHTFDGAHYNYTLNECPHVLMTDCHQKSKLAVTARQGKEENSKIVTVIYGQDTIEMDPSTGIVMVNGAKTATKTMPKGSHIEIRKTGTYRPVDIVVYPLADAGFILEIRSLFFYMKVQGTNVELAPPVHMRGRACGLCGDFNQEPKDEFKTADRCAVSSGDVMAASFMLKSGDCSSDSDASRRLLEEKETCQSADQQFHTQIPALDF